MLAFCPAVHLERISYKEYVLGDLVDALPMNEIFYRMVTAHIGGLGFSQGETLPTVILRNNTFRN